MKYEIKSKKMRQVRIDMHPEIKKEVDKQIKDETN